MYPILPRLLLGFIIFGEIYFIILLNGGITSFNLGIQEAVGGFTIFSFLFWLRIADDLKDYETDSVLFPERPLPSGRVTKRDLKIFVSCLIAVTAVLNAVFMNNFLFFAILYVYGSLMAVWFFEKYKIQKSLPLALVTHNPVQLILNIYIISFTCIKYSLPGVTATTVLAAFTLYFPALIWEVSRKIRAPGEETEYVTYSKLFGYKRATRFVLILTWVDIATNVALVWNLSIVSVILLLLNTSWMTWKFVQFSRDPTQFKIIKKVETYTYIQESLMLLTIPVYLLAGKI
jgi:4-hydroxybenzoate polyprenyltransferase